jgi:hypothetical protein
MKYFLLIATLLLFGCKVTEEKARNYYLDNKGKLAQLCVDCFGRDIPEPVYIKGEKVIEIKRDTTRDTTTVYVEVDCPDGSKVKKKLPPTETIEIEVLRVDAVYQDTWQTLALVEALKEKILQEKLLHESTKTKLHSSKKINTYFYILLGVIGIVVIYKLIIFFTKTKIP